MASALGIALNVPPLGGGNDPIYGVSWDKSATPTLTRTNDAAGMTANAGVDDEAVVNDFDGVYPYSDITEVTDASGNVFVRIPKFYIRKTDGVDYKTWQVSKSSHGSGWYLPCCFVDYVNGGHLPHIDVGKYVASLDGSNLASRADTYPLINKNIVEFRTYAENNGTGYQQLDIHVVDVLQVLPYIEFATLNLQDVMAGFTSGRYSAGYVATVAENDANRIVVADATAEQFRVGQPISVGSSLGNNSVFYGRTVTGITEYDAGNQAIEFDGDPVNIAIDDVLYNVGWKNGWSSAVAASSGCINDAANGLWPMVYRGIENVYGNVWQCVDGVNVNDNQAWVCEDARNYASNLFASPYRELAYTNHDANGWLTSTGHDSDYQFASFPTAVGGGSSSHYSDYYYQSAGQRIALLGGRWNYGSYAGLSYWSLYDSSSNASVNLGARLVRKGG